MGMALARRFVLDGNDVTVIERDEQVGGLATWHDFGGFDWDRFYHVILPSDRHLVQFVNDLGLGDALEWQRTGTGFFVDEELYSISNNIEFLKFPYLSMLSKMRLAWTMLYCSRINDWRRLENVTVEEWLIGVSGKETYERMWKPLLLAKLGQNYRRVSAVFIWSYIKRLFSARDASASAEHLGHVSGGYKMIFDRLTEVIQSGGSVRTGEQVEQVVPAPQGGLHVRVNGQEEHYDQVVCTSPVPVLRKIVDPSLLQVEDEGGQVEYLGVVCGVVVSKKPLVPYYVVNIADDQVAFTGVIGMSNVVDTRNTGGRYLTYLPKYILSSDPEFDRSDEEIRQEFEAGLKRIVPNIDDCGIESLQINRARTVQPLQVLQYSSMVPKVTTNHSDLFVVNTSQFVNATLNNNEVIGAVNRFYDDYQKSQLERAA